MTVSENIEQARVAGLFCIGPTCAMKGKGVFSLKEGCDENLDRSGGADGRGGWR